MNKGWFKIPGVQDGDRTLDDQLKGLERLLVGVSGKVVVDFGCAEGLLAQAMIERGAAAVYGLEVVPKAVELARMHCPQGVFSVCDLNKSSAIGGSKLPARADIFTMLAVLHKLRNPQRMLADVVLRMSPDLIVARMPAGTPGWVCDPRSDLKHIDITNFLAARGYALAATATGHFNEWVGYYDRT